jgi:hypothetical protein
MTSGTWNQYPEAVAAALGKAFPSYTVRVRRDRGQPPRYELLSRDGRNPVCLISPDPEEIRAVLNGEQVTNG